MWEDSHITNRLLYQLSYVGLWRVGDLILHCATHSALLPFWQESGYGLEFQQGNEVTRRPPTCDRTTGANRRLTAQMPYTSDLSKGILQIGSHSGAYKADEKSIVGIQVGADAAVNCVASGPAPHNPLRVQKASCPDQMQTLEQLWVILLRLAQVIANHIQGHVF